MEDSTDSFLKTIKEEVNGSTNLVPLVPLDHCKRYLFYFHFNIFKKVCIVANLSFWLVH